MSFDVEGIPEHNTVTKAIQLYGELTDLPPVTVWVEKRIPSEAGLGGGSSDAASVLRGLQELLGHPVPASELAHIALQVGADVPFFLVGGTAKATGYGEALTPLADVPTRWLTLARPDERCATGPMFQKLDALQYEWREFPAGDEVYNDFERVAPCACLDLIERLRVYGAESAGLSGSGSAVFGVFESREEADLAAKRIKSEGAKWAKVAPTLSREESFKRLEPL